MSRTTETFEALADAEFSSDIVWGLEDIGKVIGVNRNQAHYMLKKGQIPGSQIGKNRWYASRRLLQQHMLGKLTRGGVHDVH